MQVRFPVSGLIRRFDVAADVYRGQTGLEGSELHDDNVKGFEGQLEISRFMVNGEYARGESDGLKRTGYYLQPAVQLHPDWIGVLPRRAAGEPAVAACRTAASCGAELSAVRADCVEG